MMFDVNGLLQRQSEWQRSRARQSWGEKLRASAELRESIMQLRTTRPTAVAATPPLPQPNQKHRD